MSIMLKEIWKPIPSFDGIYEVSNLGNVKSVARFRINQGIPRWHPERILKTSAHRQGYIIVFLYKNKIRKTALVHRLVAEAFLGDSKLTVDHINGIPSDNRIENLRYCTQRENNTYGRLKRKKTSQYTGVSKTKYGGWYSCIQIGGTTVNLGTFKAEFDAHLAYQNKLNETNQTELLIVTP